MRDNTNRQDSQRAHLLEVASAVLLAIATIGSAWCAYQSARWSGVQAISISEGNAARTESARLSNRALQLTMIDVGMWVRYVSAISEGNRPLADFIAQRFRPELKTANEAWLATEPLKNAEAPSSPFAMDAYSVPEQLEAQRLATLAEQKSEEAKVANQRSDNYVLLTVIFASVLFFAGVGTKFASFTLRTVIIGIGAAVLLALAMILTTFPVH